MSDLPKFERGRQAPGRVVRFAAVAACVLVLGASAQHAQEDSGEPPGRGLPPGLVLADLAAPAAEPAADEHADIVPPVVLVLPAETPDWNAVRLRARVEDPAGIASVKAWILDPRGRTYRPLFLKAAADSMYEADVPIAPGSQEILTYYVEAADGAGNSTVNGSADSPFVVHVDTIPGANTEAGGSRRVLVSLAVVGAVLLLLGCTWTALHAPVEQAERRFWLRVLAPASQLEGLELVRAVDALCSRWHDYPDRGRIRISKEQAFFWMGVLKLTESHSLRRERFRGRSSELAGTAERLDRTREAENDLFWMHMFAPLLHLADDEARQALADLAGKPQAHPHDGIQTYDERTLARRFDWARSTPPEEVVARWKEAHMPEAEFEQVLDETEATPPSVARVPKPDARWTGPAARGAELSSSSGVTLVELLGVVALMGAMATVGGLYLRPMEAPLTSAGELTEATFKQARARAISTTGSMRVRPLSATEIVVESGSSCSAGAWTVEPRMNLRLPTQVTMGDTGWSTCFNSRGTATDNVTLTFNHPQLGSRQMELLMGGVVRWLN